MSRYEYRCGTCGPFVVAVPMGGATAQAACPVCEEAARRVFGAPGIARTPGGLARAYDRADASASEPSVVNR